MTLHWLNCQFVYADGRKHARRIYYPLQAPDGKWYGEAHLNHRYIRVYRVSTNVWVPVVPVDRTSTKGETPNET